MADLHLNEAVDRRGPYPSDLPLTRRGAEAAAECIGSWPDHEPTPLRDLPGLARALGVGRVHLKDESRRFGVGSFKALGGAYGVYRVLAAALADVGGEPTPADLRSGGARARAEDVTVACATDGNHGRAVAWGARRFGCRAVVHLPAAAAPEREAAIRAEGAEVIRVPGTYDEAVARAAEEADRHGRLLVADTSDGTAGRDVAVDIMHGYSVLVTECLDALEGPPSHVFVQAGVGGLAAAVVATLWQAFGSDRPAVVIVEPATAAPLLASARAGRPVTVEGDLRTVMACLSAGEPSRPGWAVLSRGADAFLSVPDRVAEEALRLLADGVCGDPPLELGESGVAGVAGLLALSRKPALGRAVALGPGSTVLVFGTEGPNEPSTWTRITGRAPARP